MSTLTRFIQRIRSSLDNKYEYFYLLDFGSYNLKLALFEVDRAKKEGRIVRVVEEPMGQVLSQKNARRRSHKKTDETAKNFDYIFVALSRAMERLKPSRKIKMQGDSLVIGLASEMVRGHSSSYLYRRESPTEPVDMSELKHIIQNAELKAYEEVRKKFVKESGYSELEACLIHPVVQEIKVDGHKVKSPLGFVGKEIHLSIFNAYLPSFYRNLFFDMALRLKLNVRDLFYEPYTLFSALVSSAGADFEGILIDIGGTNTRVSLVRKGKLEDIKSFSLGGASFTQRLCGEFKIIFSQADLIKIRYSANRVSSVAKGALEKMFERESSLFLNALELILQEFSQTNLLPGSIYVYGGGGNLPLIDAIIKKRNWKKNLSFLSPPKFHRIGGDIFETHFLDSSSCAPQFVSLLALSDYTLKTFAHEEDVVGRTLRRMANIIQG